MMKITVKSFIFLWFIFDGSFENDSYETQKEPVYTPVVCLCLKTCRKDLGV